MSSGKDESVMETFVSRICQIARDDAAQALHHMQVHLPDREFILNLAFSRAKLVGLQAGQDTQPSQTIYARQYVETLRELCRRLEDAVTDLEDLAKTLEAEF